MKKLKKTLLALALAFISTVILFFIMGSFLPSKWSVERSILINAMPAQIYPLVADFKTGWPQWSGFDLEDSSIHYTYSGPDNGIGTERSWTSNKMGDGSQKIIKADPQTGIEFELIMRQNPIPIAGKIVFEPLGNSTKVTWHDDGDMGKNIVFRYMAKFMDKMMGKIFETSLATLKSKAEQNSEGLKK